MTDTDTTPEPTEPTAREVFTSAAEHARGQGHDPYALAFSHLADPQPEDAATEAPAEPAGGPPRY